MTKDEAVIRGRYGSLPCHNEGIDTLKLNCRIGVFLNGIVPDHVSFEAYADGLPGADVEIIKMQLDPPNEPLSLSFFHAKVITSRPASDYAIRVVPEYEGVLVPVEENQILWQHR